MQTHICITSVTNKLPSLSFVTNADLAALCNVTVSIRISKNIIRRPTFSHHHEARVLSEQTFGLSADGLQGYIVMLMSMTTFLQKCRGRKCQQPLNDQHSHLSFILNEIGWKGKENLRKSALTATASFFVSLPGKKEGVLSLLLYSGSRHKTPHLPRSPILKCCHRSLPSNSSEALWRIPLCNTEFS